MITFNIATNVQQLKHAYNEVPGMGYKCGL